MKLLDLKPAKTYLTRDRAIKATEGYPGFKDVTYVVVVNAEGRFYPLCIGNSAISAGTHFHFATAN